MLESKIQALTAYQKQQVSQHLVTSVNYNLAFSHFAVLCLFSLHHYFVYYDILLMSYLPGIDFHLLYFQDTLIVWSEADNYDYALSFQEKAGCDEIWEKICQVIDHVPSNIR